MGQRLAVPDPVAGATEPTGDLDGLMARLSEQHVELIRIMFPDLNGVPRGKVIARELLQRACREGLTVCLATLTDGLRGHSLTGPESPRGRGHPDVRAVADIGTVRVVPWEPGTAWCLADLFDDEGPVTPAPRQALAHAIACLRAAGFEPIVGPELEFQLFAASSDLRGPFGAGPGLAYAVGRLADPGGTVEGMLRRVRELGLGAQSASREFGGAQHEINLVHGPALDAIDRAFLFKAAIKDLAAREDLIATFMGKPAADDAGNGLHLHLGLLGAEGANAMDDGSDADGLSEVARAFAAGLIAHAGPLTALLSPTVNSYKRLVPDAMAPVAANWGLDNRTCWLRVPAERGPGRRLELRAADGAANPYLALAAMLHAGLDGVEHQLEPPPLAAGDVSLRDRAHGTPLPTDLGGALNLLRADAELNRRLGTSLVNDFVAVKELELARFRAHVTDWERAEYLEPL